MNEFIIIHSQASGKMFMERVVSQDKDRAKQMSMAKEDGHVIVLTMEEYERIKNTLLRVNMCEVI